MTTETQDEARTPGQLAASVPDIALMLGISSATAWKRVKDGSIPSIRLGGRVLVPLARLEALLAGEDDADAQKGEEPVVAGSLASPADPGGEDDSG
jgi:excisionase family DNA binding protein